MADELVTIRNYTNPWEAEWARGVLASAGICCLIPDSMLTYMYNFAGPVRVQVPSSLADDAEKVLTEQEFSRKLLAREMGGEAEEAGDASECAASKSNGNEDFRALCPACGGDAAVPAPDPVPGGESPSETLLRAWTAGDELVCSACGHRWERREIEEEPDEGTAQAIDAHDVCPMPEPKRCPACGGESPERVPPPSYAGVSVLGDAFHRLLGHRWLHCPSCGHQWET